MQLNTPIKQVVSSVNILIIDDDSLMNVLYKDILESMGFNHLKLAKSGEEALLHLAQKPADLILCDWKMRGMSGLDFVKQLRATPNYQLCNIPVIMVSGKAEQEDIMLARDAGVTEYVVKPFTIKGICSKLKSIIEQPRKFVLSDVYTGPDRRRRNDTNLIPNHIDRRSHEHCTI